MALSRLTGSENTPEEVAAKINATMDAIEGEAAFRQKVQDGIYAALNEIRTNIAKVEDLTSPFAARPGEYPEAFSAELVGADPAPLDPSGSVAGPRGKVYRISGPGVVAMRSPIRLEANAFYALRLAFWRSTDAVPPYAAPVIVGVQWLDGNGGDAGQSVVKVYEKLRVQDGPQFVELRVPSITGEAPEILPPDAAVAWTPFLRNYGPAGDIDLQTMGVVEVTHAGVYLPDVTGIAGQLATIQGIIAAGFPLATPILPSYAVANLPPPGTPGRKAFATDGRAPNAAGTLEGAGAGTGVEVTDRGSAWVITGTNQQVQA